MGFGIKFETGVSIAFFTAMLIPTLYQGIRYTKTFYEQPTTTHFSSEPMPFDQITSLTICSQQGIYPASLGEATMAYMAGFSVNNDLVDSGSSEEPFRSIAWSDEVLAAGKQGYVKAFGQNAKAPDVLANISAIMAGNLETEKPDKGVKFTPVKTEPNFVQASYYCAAIPRTDPIRSSSLSYNENSNGAMDDMLQFIFTTGYPILEPCEEVDLYQYVSLYSVNPLPFMNMRKHFIHYEYEVENEDEGGKSSGNGQASTPGAVQGTTSAPELRRRKREAREKRGDGWTSSSGAVTGSASASHVRRRRRKREASDDEVIARDVVIRVDVSRQIRLQTRSEQCVKEEGYIFPVGFLSRKCQILCEDEAYRSIHGCSILTYYGIDKAVGQETTLPPCHMYDGSLPGKVPPYATFNASVAGWSLDTRIDDYNRECARKKACSSQSHCEEWDIRVRSVAVSETPAENVEVPKGLELHRISILLSDKATVARQVLKIDLEGWIGTVGGIVGIYLGASFFSVVVWASAFLRDRHQRKKTDAGKT